MTNQLEKPRHVRHVGAERETLTATLKDAYEKGASIRELAEEHQLSYGKVHRVLSEGGVQLRGRGGPTRQRRGLTRVQALEYRQRLASVKVK